MDTTSLVHVGRPSDAGSKVAARSKSARSPVVALARPRPDRPDGSVAPPSGSCGHAPIDVTHNPKRLGLFQKDETWQIIIKIQQRRAERVILKQEHYLDFSNEKNRRIPKRTAQGGVFSAGSKQTNAVRNSKS